MKNIHVFCFFLLLIMVVLPVNNRHNRDFLFQQSLNSWAPPSSPTTTTGMTTRFTSSSPSWSRTSRERRRPYTLTLAECARWESSCPVNFLGCGPAEPAAAPRWLSLCYYQSVRMIRGVRGCWWIDGAPSWRPVSSAPWPGPTASTRTLTISVRLQDRCFADNLGINFHLFIIIID